ncbi:hypothetical protein [Halopseudomonas salegens]|uniref:Uncharacterized protein n=1 Tax=Halopseudomonas salegens TaxID=1434072 RepID=A0A1H2HKT4_9GAMM|nr:hypothetical protein [Halopseudomonas salegens]SDU32491.1 hypothetical protein SAMN05216210_3121 [Halopseudomonas salegens]
MSIDTLILWSYLWTALFVAAMLCFVVIFVIHFFVPKVLIATYFKEPYFSPKEIEFFTGFPFGYIRTVMFMRVVGWPSSGKKRGLTQAYKLSPSWFRRTSIIFVLIFVAVSVPMFMLGIFLYFSFCVFHGRC